MKIFILVLILFSGFSGFSQQNDSLSILKPKSVNNVTHDSVKIALDIVIDSTGKFIMSTYSVDGSTTLDKKMIEIAKRKASQLKYPARKEKYTSRLIFNFKIVQ